MTDTILDRLEAAIAARRSGASGSSYVAKLAAKGRAHIAKKVGEEGVELALASVTGSREEIVGEAADLLFHMLMLLADCDLTLADALAELERREGVSGIAEKAGRKAD